jgi:hypothetical protein
MQFGIEDGNIVEGVAYKILIKKRVFGDGKPFV